MNRIINMYKIPSQLRHQQETLITNQLNILKKDLTKQKNMQKLLTQHNDKLQEKLDGLKLEIKEYEEKINEIHIKNKLYKLYLQKKLQLIE